MDPNTEDGKVRFYVNDVGQAKWEETSEGGTDFIGAHYGWPMREGPCPNSKVEDCADEHPYQDPIHFYIHNSEAGGGACTGKLLSNSEQKAVFSHLNRHITSLNSISILRWCFRSERNLAGRV